MDPSDAALSHPPCDKAVKGPLMTSSPEELGGVGPDLERVALDDEVPVSVGVAEDPSGGVGVSGSLLLESASGML